VRRLLGTSKAIKRHFFYSTNSSSRYIQTLSRWSFLLSWHPSVRLDLHLLDQSTSVCNQAQGASTLLLTLTQQKRREETLRLSSILDTPSKGRERSWPTSIMLKRRGETLRLSSILDTPSKGRERSWPMSTMLRRSRWKHCQKETTSASRFNFWCRFLCNRQA